MSKSLIFRKAALRHPSSPEQLDHLAQVTRPRGWMALAATSLLLVMGVVWGLTGQVADKVQGRGILVRSGGVLEVVAPASGRVVDISIAPGQSVSEGQVIAWLAQPELHAELQKARTALTTAREEHADALRFSAHDARVQNRVLDQQQAELEGTIRAAEGLLRAGASGEEAERAREQLRSARRELSQIALRRLEAENQRRQALGSSQAKVVQAEAEVARLERELQASTQVVSTYTGRILELMTEPGQIVERGEPIVSLDLTGSAVQDLVAVVYVPGLYGKMVRPGMRIYVAPSTVRQEEFGMMLGTVTFVSDYPATTRGMMRVLKNEQLVQELSGGGTPYELHATLIPDPNTMSRYRWSSSKGPPMRIESGTIANATIVTSEHRPAEFVLPFLRRWTGI
jgi:HlyD family secretion protein